MSALILARWCVDEPPARPGRLRRRARTGPRRIGAIRRRSRGPCHGRRLIHVQGETYDAAGMEILDAAESRRLLGSVPIGRVVFTDRAMPAVQPVNFVVHDGAVVFRT